MIPPEPSLAWLDEARKADGSTLLTTDEIIAGGGGVALRAYVTERLTAVAASDVSLPNRWAAFAVEHLTDRVGDATDGGVEVSTASLQMILAYVAHLEQIAAKGGAR